MTLLTTVFAAVISTAFWYKGAPKSEMKVGILCWLYWGSALMWFVDAIFEYAQLREQYFTPAPLEMLNDFYLGLSVVALGMVIWIVYLLVKDPKGAIRDILFKKRSVSDEK